MLGSRFFSQNPFFNDFINIGRRQRQAGVKTPLNFGEVIAPQPHVFGDGINILLTGNNNPCLALASGAKVFGHCLQVQHEFGIVPYVLANFIHQKHHVMIVAFTVNILLYQFGKVFNTDGIGLCRFFAPVAGRRLAHELHSCKNIHNGVLNKIKLMPGLLPKLAEIVGKFFFEFLIASSFRQGTLQVCQKRNRTAEALHFVEYFQKHRNNGVF